MTIPKDTVEDKVLFCVRFFAAKHENTKEETYDMIQEHLDTMTRQEFLASLSEAIEERFTELQRLITLKT